MTASRATLPLSLLPISYISIHGNGNWHISGVGGYSLPFYSLMRLVQGLLYNSHAHLLNDKQVIIILEREFNVHGN
jgi:hypothetical protein